MSEQKSVQLVLKDSDIRGLSNNKRSVFAVLFVHNVYLYALRTMHRKTCNISTAPPIWELLTLNVMGQMLKRFTFKMLCLTFIMKLPSSIY